MQLPDADSIISCQTLRILQTHFKWTHVRNHNIFFIYWRISAFAESNVESRKICSRGIWRRLQQLSSRFEFRLIIFFRLICKTPVTNWLEFYAERFIQSVNLVHRDVEWHHKILMFELQLFTNFQISWFEIAVASGFSYNQLYIAQWPIYRPESYHVWRSRIRLLSGCQWSGRYSPNEKP